MRKIAIAQDPIATTNLAVFAHQLSQNRYDNSLQKRCAVACGRLSARKPSSLRSWNALSLCARAPAGIRVLRLARSGAGNLRARRHSGRRARRGLYQLALKNVALGLGRLVRLAREIVS
jgi:hypothetical protein